MSKLKTIKCNTWEEFEEKAIKLAKTPIKNSLPTLFRGHSNAKWELESTLYRFFKKDFPAKKYFNIIKKMLPKISAFYNKTFNIKQIENDIKNINKSKSILLKYKKNPDLLMYLTYLRQNGFPSPLLDWTRSPYIAAFFAFSDIAESTKSEAKVAIFSFTRTKSDKHSENGDLSSIGHNIETDKKHYLQQSEYTYCFNQDKGNNDKFCFISENIFYENYTNSKKIIKQYTIPISERNKVLKILNLMNFNYFSLFGTEESLMKTFAVNELFLSKNRIFPKNIPESQ